MNLYHFNKYFLKIYINLKINLLYLIKVIQWPPWKFASQLRTTALHITLKDYVFRICL